MNASDLQTLANLLKDGRNPCQRDGHAYQIVGTGASDIVFCSKCGKTKKLPDPGKIGFSTQSKGQ